jgi:hypothetical protein
VIYCVIITIVMNIGATEPECSVPLCVCKSNNIARCMNHVTKNHLKPIDMHCATIKYSFQIKLTYR